MKTIYKLTLLFLLLPVGLSASIVKGKYTKEKKIEKGFAVNSNAGLQVGNKFGNIAITTWDQDRTEIEVVITVSGNNEDDVVKRLNSIDVEFDATKALVTAMTRFGNAKGKSSMEINYTIRIPKNGTLGINNQYGSIKLGKIYGGMNIDLQYGNIIIDEANSEVNKLNLQYANGSRIGYIKTMDLKMQYSDMNIVKSGAITANTDYSQIKVDEVRTISLDMDYGDLNVGYANIINLKSDYSGFKCGRLDNLLNASVNYGNVKVNSITQWARSIVVKGTYSEIKLGFAPETAFSFEFDTEYGGLGGKELLNFSEKTEKDIKAHYVGSSKAGEGNCKVYAKSEYGEIRISRN